jgi:hypothetical protein
MFAYPLVVHSERRAGVRQRSLDKDEIVEYGRYLEKHPAAYDAMRWVGAWE